jgi:hypothetical protein
MPRISNHEALDAPSRSDLVQCYRHASRRSGSALSQASMPSTIWR